MAAAIAGSFGTGTSRVETRDEARAVVVTMQPADTVIYPSDGWKAGRKGDFEAFAIADSLLDNGSAFEDYADSLEILDTIPKLTARDTIKAPDSLRLTDPFRFKYYVALLDSATHILVRDSLRSSSDTLKAHLDTLRARIDSLDAVKLDSLYYRDSALRAKAAFDAWYYSLSKQDRKKYDLEQKSIAKKKQLDSINAVKEAEKEVKDSINESTPRILETFAIADSLHYKRIISWTVDQDFHRIAPETLDTTFNHHFHDDYPFRRKDVNATWLGVEGSAVQYYNYFNRKSDEDIPFYDAFEAWSVSPRTMRQWNTKTPYTELCYMGTILANQQKESDNLHLFTTQNITPALNFSLLFNRFGGGGFLENEEIKNNTAAVGINYLGKKYMGHFGFISNKVNQGENGGIQDPAMIRDTLLESREIAVALKDAKSKTTKKTVYLDQELRIPFNFINEIKAKRDSTFHFVADSLDRDITTAFLGHSSEFSVYTRNYNDKINDNETFAREYYNNVFNWNPRQSADSMRVMKLDNKVFIKLQPWAADAIVSKLNVGAGYRMMQYFDSTSVHPSTYKDDAAYLYAGVEGQYRNNFFWNAKGDFVFAGTRIGDFGIEADARLELYPFRRARKSPLGVSAHFETSLRNPDHYQQMMFSNHYKWENDFKKISTTKIEGIIDIPYWKLRAKVGYALLGNNIYYDTLGVVRQNEKAMHVLSADVRKDLVFGPLHLENRALVQYSSNQEVLPLPLLAVNARWYFQFVVQRDETKTRNVMEMQIGVDARYNTKWYAPAWNPAMGVFHNQNKEEYTCGPYFDVFVNVQWKRAVIFLKYLNAGRGWPMESRDYFSADRHIIPQSGGLSGLQVGLYWPFYVQPGKPHNESKSK